MEKIQKKIPKERDYSSEFCVFCGGKKTFDRIINTKLGAICVSLCTKDSNRTAKEILEKKNYIKRSETGYYPSNYDLKEKYGIKVLSSVADVSRKKDL